MPVPLRLVNIGLAQCADPIFQHVTRRRVDQAQGKTCLVIFGRSYPVEAVLGEEIGPALKLVGIEAMNIISKELLQLPLPLNRAEIHRLTTPSRDGRRAKSRARKPRWFGWARRCARNRPS